MLYLPAPPVSGETQQNYVLFPVPFDGFPWLKCNLKNPEPVTMQILSVSGQLICTHTLSMDGLSVIALNDFNRLPPGLYFIRLISASGQQALRAMKQ